MIETIRDMWRKRAILWHFVNVLLSASYRTRALGFVWALLDPLLFMGVYYLVFGKILANRPPEFMLHIYVGVITFRFLNSSLTQGSGMLRGQGGLIREIPFPKTALPVATVIARLFDFSAGWLVAIPLAFVFGHPPNVWWLMIPVFVLIQTLFVTGLTLITTYVGLFFADIQNILGVGLRLWFYMSPVLYPLALVQKKTAERPDLMALYLTNPITSVLQCYNAVLLENRLPAGGYVLYGVGAGVAAVLLGLWIFSRGEGQIAKYL